MTRSVVHQPGKAHGASAGCPFCRSARTRLPEVGTRFRLLSGFNAGRTGTVVQSPAPLPLSRDEFLAQMDGEPQHMQRRILPIDIIEPIPAPEPPEWAPPVELGVAAELDSVVVKFCEAGNRESAWIVDWPAFYEVVRFIWSKRLPLQAEETWAVLRAHGVPDQFREELLEFFQRGRELLVYAVGKKPIKKRRVKPLAVSP